MTNARRSHYADLTAPADKYGMGFRYYKRLIRLTGSTVVLATAGVPIEKPSYNWEERAMERMVGVRAMQQFYAMPYSSLSTRMVYS